MGLCFFVLFWTELSPCAFTVKAPGWQEGEPRMGLLWSLNSFTASKTVGFACATQRDHGGTSQQ